jgi:hypothetical protein
MPEDLNLWQFHCEKLKTSNYVINGIFDSIKNVPPHTKTEYHIQDYNYNFRLCTFTVGEDPIM